MVNQARFPLEEHLQPSFLDWRLSSFGISHSSDASFNYSVFDAFSLSMDDEFNRSSGLLREELNPSSIHLQLNDLTFGGSLLMRDEWQYDSVSKLKKLFNGAVLRTNNLYYPLCEHLRKNPHFAKKLEK